MFGHFNPKKHLNCLPCFYSQSIISNVKTSHCDSKWRQMSWQIGLTFVANFCFSSQYGDFDPLGKFRPIHDIYCGQLWVWHIVCGQTCDGLDHVTFCLIIFGIPIGSHTIRSTLARHTGVRRVCGSRHGDHVITSTITGVHGLCFGYLVSGPLLNVPWYTVHFRGSLSGSP